MNYHRVVIQLYTWAFYLSRANKDSFSQGLYERVSRALNFLYNHQDEESGMLPNYGANDGALFFQLNSCHFRDFRPQLNALNFYFLEKSLCDQGKWNEDIFWYTNKTTFEKLPVHQKSRSYETGGYYIMRDENKFSFIRCGKHKDRPSQADNLHLDIWVNGKNLLFDAGSYKYNSTPEDIKYFMGTSSHNTVMIEDYDQMQKGGRFIWHYWSQAMRAKIVSHADHQFFKGKIHAFKHVGKNIFHTRIVKQYKKELKWEVEDFVENTKLNIKQIWNISPDFFKEDFEIISTDKNGNRIEAQLTDAWHSPTYGVKEKSKQIIFQTGKSYFKTIISKRMTKYE